MKPVVSLTNEKQLQRNKIYWISDKNISGNLQEKSRLISVYSDYAGKEVIGSFPFKFFEPYVFKFDLTDYINSDKFIILKDLIAYCTEHMDADAYLASYRIMAYIHNKHIDTPENMYKVCRIIKRTYIDAVMRNMEDEYKLYLGYMIIFE